MAATLVSLSSNESYHSDFPSLNGLSLEAQDFDLKQQIEGEYNYSSVRQPFLLEGQTVVKK